MCIHTHTHYTKQDLCQVKVSGIVISMTLQGGGHTAAKYRPSECYNMFKMWISHEPL